MLFQVVQIIYWLALATWFGSGLFIAMAAPVVFQVVRRNNPILPGVLAVNLDGQHATLLANSIVAELMNRLNRLQVLCAAALLLALIAQPFVINMAERNTVAAVLRSVLFVLAAALVVYHWLALWPRIMRFRQEYIEHADEPEIANPAKEQFDREHHRSVWLLQAIVFLLLGVILFSANITPKPALRAPQEATYRHAPSL